MWRWKSDWGWCLGGAYFLAKFQAGGAYSGGAYKKNVYRAILMILGQALVGCIPEKLGD